MSNADKLRLFSENIRRNPQDPQAWAALGEHASLLQEKTIAAGAYLAALYLDGNNVFLEEKWNAARRLLFEGKDENTFAYEIFRLPLQTFVILFFGILNMEVDDLKAKFAALKMGGFTKACLDFRGVKAMSGLGPSFVRKVEVELKPGNVVMSEANADIREMLHLKKIDLPQYPSLREGLVALRK